MTERRKTNPPLHVDMEFGEALERYLRVSPKEVAESEARSKAKKPPEDGPRRPKRTPPDRKR